ncbi:unnamed protein product [Arctogadus glacialis]
MNLLLFLLLALLLPHCGSAVDADLSSKFLQASVKEANAGTRPGPRAARPIADLNPSAGSEKAQGLRCLRPSAEKAQGLRCLRPSAEEAQGLRCLSLQLRRLRG